MAKQILVPLEIYGDITDDAGNTIYDYSAGALDIGVIPVGDISHDSITGVSKGDHRTDEEIQDLVDTLLAAGDKLSWTYDDAGDTLTVDTTALDQEEVDDFVASMITAGNAITVTRDDAANTVTIAVDESGISLANLGSKSHSDLSDAPTNAHISNLTDVPTRNHNDTQNISATDHHDPATQDVDSVDGYDVSVVDSMPGTPDSNTLYFVRS